MKTLAADPGRASAFTSVLLAASIAAQGAEPKRCRWSPEWESISSGVRAAVETKGSVVTNTPPRRRKGSLTRPRPNPGERYVLEGLWEVEIVVDAQGSVLDAKIVRSASTPPWPRYEAALLRSIRKWRFEPARLNGIAVGACVVQQAQDR